MSKSLQCQPNQPGTLFFPTATAFVHIKKSCETSGSKACWAPHRGLVNNISLLVWNENMTECNRDIMNMKISPVFLSLLSCPHKKLCNQWERYTLPITSTLGISLFRTHVLKSCWNLAISTRITAQQFGESKITRQGSSRDKHITSLCATEDHTQSITKK